MSVSPYGSPPDPPSQGQSSSHGQPPPQGQVPAYGAATPYPPPGYVVQPVYAVSPPTNGLAVTSMICSIVGLVFFWIIPFLLSVLGVIFGHVALSQISARGQGGRGMAITGLVIGYVVVGLLLVAAVGLGGVWLGLLSLM